MAGRASTLLFRPIICASFARVLLAIAYLQQSHAGLGADPAPSLVPFVMLSGTQNAITHGSVLLATSRPAPF